MLQRPTPAVLNLIFANLVVFLLWQFAIGAGDDVQDFFRQYFLIYKIDAIWPRDFHAFQPVQLVTAFFSHFDLGHLFFNMLGLYFLGTPLEKVIGSRRFLGFYLYCGVLSTLLTALFDPLPNPVLGASGAVYALMIGLVAYFPNWEMQLLFPPVRVRAQVLGFVMYLYSGIQVFYIHQESYVSHFGHFMGLLAAILFFLLDKRLLKIK